MKKQFLVCLAVISFTATIAQTEKGTFAISGNVGLGFASTTIKYELAGQTQNGPKTTSFSVAPSAAYFVIDNLAIGLLIDYTSSKSSYQNSSFKQEGNPNVGSLNGDVIINSNSLQQGLAFMPNATYFFGKEKLKPFVGFGFGFANAKNSSSQNTSSPTGAIIYSKINSKAKGTVWSTSTGFAYFVSKTMSLNLGLEYSKFTLKENNLKTKSGTFGTNFGISVFLK